MIDNNYLKTARECTAKFTVKQYMHTREDVTIGFHATNFSIAELIYNGEYRYLKLYRVVGSGDDYLPHVNFTINDAIVDPQPTPVKFTFNGENFTKWCQDIVKLWDLDKYPDLNTLKDPVACWASQGLDPYATIEIYRYDIDNILPYNAIIDFWELLDFTDASGEGLYISGYGNYPINTQLLDDIDYTSLRTSAVGGGDRNVYEIPDYANTDDSFPFYFNFYVNNAEYALGKRTDYITTPFYEQTKAGFMYDGNADMSLIGFQIIGGVYLDNLREVGNYHKFRGIQWDIYVDGEGKATGITVIPTFLGGDPPKGFNARFWFTSNFKHDFAYLPSELLFNDADVYIDNATDGTQYAYVAFDLLGNQIPADVIDNPAADPWAEAYIGFRGGGNDDVKRNVCCAFTVVTKDGMDGVIYQYNGDGKSNEPDNDDKSVVIVHRGAPPDSDDYDNSGEDSDNIDEGTGYNGIGLLTKQYSLTANRAQQLGWQLWEAGFIDNIKLVNNSPMENVISLKALPFNISGNDEEIVLGNVPMNVNGEKITSFDGKRLIGSIEITGMYNSFLDFAPFTKITIFLPFIGFKDLDVSAIMYKTLTVYYIIDILTGACRAELRVDNVPFVCFDGDIGIDISLAASNRAQVEAAFITSAASNITSGVGSATSGNVEGVAKSVIGLAESAMNQYHTTNSGAPSPACSAYQTRDVYLIYDRPTYQDLKAFNRTHGRMCMLSRTLGTLSGYTVTSPNVDLSGVTATDEEKEEIIKILSSGFFA